MYAAAVQDLVDELGRLPGVGPKSAQRIAFYLLKVAKEDALGLANTLLEGTAKTMIWELCFNIGTSTISTNCTDERRDLALACVVEDPRDIVAVERTREFRG